MRADLVEAMLRGVSLTQGWWLPSQPGGQQHYPWPRTDALAQLLHDGVGNDCSRLVEGMLDDDTPEWRAYAAAFLLGRADRIKVRKLLHTHATHSPKYRDLHRWYQRGRSNDLFGQTYENSQEVAKISIGHLFHRASLLNQVLEDGCLTPAPRPWGWAEGSCFDAIFLTDWLPWCYCTSPKRRLQPDYWGILCWKGDEFLNQRKRDGIHPSFRHFADEDAPEYLIPDPPMDLDRLAAVLLPIEATDVDVTLVRRCVPGVPVLRALSRIWNRRSDSTCSLNTYAAFHNLSDSVRNSYDVENLGIGTYVKEESSPDPSEGSAGTNRRRADRKTRRATVRQIASKLLDKNGPRDEEITKYTRILGRLRWKESRSLLVSMLTGQRKVRGDQDLVATSSISALTRHQDKADIPLFRRFMLDSAQDCEIRVAAIMALGRLQYPEAIDAIREFRDELPPIAVAASQPPSRGRNEQDEASDPVDHVTCPGRLYADIVRSGNLELISAVAPAEEFAYAVLLADAGNGCLMLPTTVSPDVFWSHDETLRVMAAFFARHLSTLDTEWGWHGLSWLLPLNPFAADDLWGRFKSCVSRFCSLSLSTTDQESLKHLLETYEKRGVQGLDSLRCDSQPSGERAPVQPTQRRNDKCDREEGQSRVLADKEWDDMCLLHASEQRSAYGGRWDLHWYFLMSSNGREQFVASWLAELQQEQDVGLAQGCRPFQNCTDWSRCAQAIVGYYEEDAEPLCLLVYHTQQSGSDGGELLAEGIAELISTTDLGPRVLTRLADWLDVAGNRSLPASFYNRLLESLGQSGMADRIQSALALVLRYAPWNQFGEVAIQRTIQFAQKCIISDCTMDRYHALAILAEISTELARDTLAKAIRQLAEGPVHRMRSDAARAITRARRADLVDVLDKLICDNEERPRIAALRAIGKLKLNECFDLVAARLDSGVTEAEEYAAICACIDLGDTRAIPRLREIARTDSSLRPAATDGLVRLGDTEGILNLMDSSDVDVVVQSFETLLEIPDNVGYRRSLYGQFGARLRELAKKSCPPQVRGAAISLLGRIGGGRDIPVIKPCLYDEQNAVRIAATRALTRIRPKSVMAYLMDDGNFLLTDTSIARARILGEILRMDDRRASENEKRQAKSKLFEILGNEAFMPQERMQAALSLRSGLPRGAFLRAMLVEWEG